MGSFIIKGYLFAYKDSWVAQWQRIRLPLSREDSPEEEMTNHSSILAWKISWTEEPGRLQSMGLQRVRHD